MPGKKLNPWIAHIKSESKKRNITYMQALKNSDVKASYKPKPNKLKAHA